jgi:hypothetical protein
MAALAAPVVAANPAATEKAVKSRRDTPSLPELSLSMFSLLAW